MTIKHIQYRIKYMKPRYKADSHKFRIFLKKKFDNVFFYYDVVEWCAVNLKGKFSLAKYGVLAVIIITNSSDKDIFIAYWLNPKRHIKKEIYST